jgi:hypothetical protein
VSEAIEIYIRTEEVLTNAAIIGRPISDGTTTHYCTMRETAKKEKVMPETDRLILEIVKEFADSKGIRLEVCDVSTFGGKLKARFKGVKTVPAIVIGDVRIEGEQALNLSTSVLESFLTRH